MFLNRLFFIPGVLENRDISAKVKFLIFILLFFTFITFLHVITKFINLTRFIRGYFFIACQTAVHKKCHDKLLTKCPESGRESENTIVSIRIYH